jgi:hypothetical protein
VTRSRRRSHNVHPSHVFLEIWVLTLQNTETQMRRLKIMEHISLDGVIQHSADDDGFPYRDWTAPYRSPAGWARGSASLRTERRHARSSSPARLQCRPATSSVVTSSRGL